MSSPKPFLAFLALLGLAGCASNVPPPSTTLPEPILAKAAPAKAKPPAPVHTQYQAHFENGLILDYAVETKRSRIDGKSCYSFISGTLENSSSETLSHRTAVRFQVFHRGNILFEDYAYLRSMLPPGNRVQFDVVQSPLHMKQCPTYDKIDVALRKIALN